MQRVAVFRRNSGNEVLEFLRRDYAFMDFLTDLDNFYVVYGPKSEVYVLSTNTVENFYDNSFIDYFNILYFHGFDFKVIGKGQVFGYGGRCVGDVGRYYSRIFQPQKPIDGGRLVFEYRASDKPAVEALGLVAKCGRWEYDLLEPYQNKRGALKFMDTSKNKLVLDFKIPFEFKKLTLKVLFRDRFEIRRIVFEEVGL